MLDRILFWVVLVWMVALLVLAIWAVREVWKEDNREPTETDGAAPPEANTRETTQPNSPGAGQSVTSGKAEGLN